MTLILSPLRRSHPPVTFVLSVWSSLNLLPFNDCRRRSAGVRLMAVMASSEELLSFTIPEYSTKDGTKETYYHIHVRFGSQQWVVKKTYDDFRHGLHERARKKFGEADLPYFTGPLAMFNVAEKRRPKLEEYLNELVKLWPRWRPRKGLVWELPHPDGLPHKVQMHDYIKSFIELDEHFVGVDLSGIQDKNIAQEKAAAAAEAQAKLDAARMAEQIQNANLSETEARRLKLQLEQQQAPKEPTPAVDFDMIDDALVENIRKGLARFSGDIDVHVSRWKERESPHRHIVYVVEVSICGTAWTVEKRFSEFQKFHALVCKVYREAADHLPELADVYAPAWEKLDPEVCVNRQSFFTGYLNALKNQIDSWAPLGKTRQIHFSSTPLQANGGVAAKKDIVVEINELLYDFLDFAAHTASLDVQQVVEVQKRKEHGLSDADRDALVRTREEEAHVAREENFKQRAKLLRGTLDDAEVEDFAAMLSSFVDDRDAIRLAQRFVDTGYYTDTPRSVNRSKLSAPVDGKESHCQPATNAVRSEEESMRCSIRSADLCRLIQRIEFDDTRAELLRVFSLVLVEESALESALEWILYDWDALRRELRDIMARPPTTQRTA